MPIAGRACTRHCFGDKDFGGDLSTLDLVKGLIDEGYHPMTMYFPLVVHGAMLVEPTETESKATLDQFIHAFRTVAKRANAGDEQLKQAPFMRHGVGWMKPLPRVNPSSRGARMKGNSLPRVRR